MFKSVKDLFKAKKALDHIRKIKEEVNTVGSKNILASKTFWFNLLTAGVSVAGLLPIDTETALLITNGLNIGLRIISGQAVNLWPEK